MEGFKLIGIKLDEKTKNAGGQSAKDCGALWQYFGANTIAERIPNKVSQDIYAVYYEYESDENGLFSYFIGCKVEVDTVKPEGLDEVIIPEQNYHIETAKGQVPACIAEAWGRIWNGGIDRKFGYDFEVYGEKSQNWEDAEVSIFLSIKE